MNRRKTVLAAAFFVLAAGCAAPIAAQATRTWVSGVGDDVNPCSRTAPCKTFAGAISKTAAGGEINCLDPGGFGAVTITKALSIVCQFTEGGVLVVGAGVSGVIVNAGANDHIYLRGLDFHGGGSGQNGVRFIAGGSLTIEDSLIRSFNANNGIGVSFQPSGAARLNINNTTINNIGSGSTGNGILIQPTGAGGSARVSLDNVRVQSSANTGIRVDSTGNTNANGVSVQITNSLISGNGSGIAAVQASGTNPVLITLLDSSVINNTGAGITANGTSAFMRVGNTTITGNGSGVSVLGGSTIETYGNNRLISNPFIGVPNNGAFSFAPIPEQ